MATIAFPKATNPCDEVPQFPHAAKAITPSDDDIFERPVTIHVGVGGTVVILPANGGDAVPFDGMAAGSVVPCMAIGVLFTGTSATNLVAVY